MDNRPGRDWFRRFSKRHPKISERIAEPLGKERAILTPAKLDHWFEDLRQYLEGEGCADILEDGHRIYNCDESGFPLSGSTIKVIAERGSRNVYQITNSDKRQITVLACMAACGTYILPMLIFPGKRFKYNPLGKAPTDWMNGKSDNGWIDQAVFYEWLGNHFLEAVKATKCKLPVLLLLDGHRSHVSLETAKLCAENGVVLYCFPAHASHIIQPCDLTLFGSLKSAWKIRRREWQQQHPGENVTKQNFAEVFADAWADSARPEIAVNGFRAAGIFPFTKRYDTSKLDPARVFTSQQGASAPLEADPAAPPGQAHLPANQPAPTQQDLPGPSTTSPEPQVLTPCSASDNLAALRVLEGTMPEEKR